MIREMHRRECPIISNEHHSECYWCGHELYDGDTYRGDEQDAHDDECPWVTVLAYSGLHDDPPGQPVGPDRDDPGR
jgi:hypothetical protein